MSVAAEKGSEQELMLESGWGCQRMGDAPLEAVWLHEKMPSRRSITLWDYEGKGKPPPDSCKGENNCYPYLPAGKGFCVSLLLQAWHTTQPVKLFQCDSAQFVLKSPTYTQTHVQEARKLQLVLGAQLLGLYTSARKKGILVETCSVCCSVCKPHIFSGMLCPQRVIRMHGKKKKETFAHCSISALLLHIINTLNIIASAH